MKLTNPELPEFALDKLERYMRKHASAVVSLQRADRSETIEDGQSLGQLVAFLRNRRYGVMAVACHVKSVVAPPPQPRRPMAYFAFNLGVDGDDGGTLERDLQAAAELLDHDSVLSLRIGMPATLIGTCSRAGVVPALGQRRVIADITTKSRAQDVLSAMLGQQFVIDQVQEIPYPDSLFGVWGMRAAARNVDRKLGNGKKPPRPCP